MNEQDFRKYYEAEWPPLIDDVYRAHAILAEKLYNYPDRPLTGCTSYIQRQLQCGYNHAAAIMDLMENEGGITQTDNKGARQLKPMPRTHGQ